MLNANSCWHFNICEQDKFRAQLSWAWEIVREPVIGLIKWLRPKGLKVCSYVEKCAEFKNQTLKKIGWYTKVLCATEYPRVMQTI